MIASRESYTLTIDFALRYCSVPALVDSEIRTKMIGLVFKLIIIIYYFFFLAILFTRKGRCWNRFSHLYPIYTLDSFGFHGTNRTPPPKKKTWSRYPLFMCILCFPLVLTNMSVFLTFITGKEINPTCSHLSQVDH